MKYLNGESQFTRVSDADANALMEAMGYSTQVQEMEAPLAPPSVYKNGEERFSLTNEVVEASDDSMYVKLERLEAGTIIHVDESGNEQLTESISYEEDEYLLEGVFEDDEGFLYARLVNENAEEADEEYEE